MNPWILCSANSPWICCFSNSLLVSLRYINSPCFCLSLSLSLSVSLSLSLPLSVSLSLSLPFSGSLSLCIFLSLAVSLCLSMSLSIYLCLSLILSVFGSPFFINQLLVYCLLNSFFIKRDALFCNASLSVKRRWLRSACGLLISLNQNKTNNRYRQLTKWESINLPFTQISSSWQTV